jgi:DNA-binding NtrC family response regulator
MEGIVHKLNKTCILIEDDRIVCLYLKSCLEDMFERPHIFNSVKESLEFLKSTAEKLDIILLDYFLEDGTAVDVLKELPDSSPVIIVSGSNDPEVINNTIEFNIHSFLKKPFSAADLEFKILSCLNIF